MMKKMMFLGVLSAVLSCGDSSNTSMQNPTPTTPTPTCSDSKKNGTETDIDCGGSCGPCGDTKACAVAGDCSSSSCASGVCAAPSCSDIAKNGNETDVDCGGSCGACADTKACAVMGDCTSGVCQSNKCVAPTCMDQVKNENESDTDCGGSCAGCDLDKKCAATTDCATNTICDTTSKRCRTATSCSEIHQSWPNTTDGAYKIAPTGTATPFSAVCDMTRDGGGWTLLLKASGDSTMAYNSTYWTDDNLLNETDLTKDQGNAKYQSFLALPVAKLRGELDGYVFPMTIAGGLTAKQIFAGDPNVVTPYPVMIDAAPKWSVQPNCQYYGVNDAFNFNKVRFGWTANQEGNCDSNDTSIGLGLTDTNGGFNYGAGYVCASTQCNHDNVDSTGSGLLWAQ